MIDIKTLTENDKGRWVVYSKTSEKQFTGRIKSWNETVIFVVYKCDGDWNNFSDYTAEATRADDLLEQMKGYCV